MENENTLFDFDGKTFDAELDGKRLGKQLEMVRRLMEDQKWRSAMEISERLGAPHASVLARLTDLRKEKFGAYPVERRRREGLVGTWEFQLGLKGDGIPNSRPMVKRIKELEIYIEQLEAEIRQLKSKEPQNETTEIANDHSYDPDWARDLDDDEPF